MKRIIFCLLSATLSSIASLPLIAAPTQPIANYQILFSPEDKVAEELISLIDKETKSVKAAVYSLMHKGIAQALINAKSRGVDVEVIVDPSTIKSRCPVNRMKQAHVPIFVWSPAAKYNAKNGKQIKQRRSLMHDKFCILGDKCVWTGSFNFTFQATSSNRENVVILESPQVASQYLAEFNKLKKAGCVPLGTYVANKALTRR